MKKSTVKAFLKLLAGRCTLINTPGDKEWTFSCNIKTTDPATIKLLREVVTEVYKNEDIHIR